MNRIAIRQMVAGAVLLGVVMVVLVRCWPEIAHAGSGPSVVPEGARLIFISTLVMGPISLIDSVAVARVSRSKGEICKEFGGKMLNRVEGAKYNGEPVQILIYYCFHPPVDGKTT